MTTFQALVDAFLQGIITVLPLSEKLDDFLTRSVLDWTIPRDGLALIIGLMASLSLLIFFRYDWLALVSSLIRSIGDPQSLGEERRNLDQHTFIFFLCVLVPLTLAQRFLTPLINEMEWSSSPYVMLILSLAISFGFRFSYRWNKRIHGLNHLKLKDAFVVAGLSLLSIHPALPLLGLFWIAFSLKNYHYEAIFKYSFMMLGIVIFGKTLTLLDSVGVVNAINEVGRLNSVAVLVIGFSVIWMTLENLQRNLGEATFRAFQWLSIGVGIFFISMYWFKK